MITTIEKFIYRHVFQALALLITFIGLLGYAAGKSFVNGWYQTAGVPSALFPLDAYEIIFQGFGVTSPWKLAAGFLIVLAIVMAIFALQETWLTERAKVLRHKRKPYESKKSLKTRKDLAYKARKENPKGILHAKWKALGPRGMWVERRNQNEKWISKHAPYLRIGAFSLLASGFMLIIGVCVWMISTFFMKEAQSEGVRQYVGIYAAVTGKLPSQFRQDSMHQHKLQEYICAGKNELWKYRAFSLEDTPGSDKDYAYLLRATDKFMFVLNTEGSELRLVTVKELNLKESRKRPLSQIADKCDS